MNSSNAPTNCRAEAGLDASSNRNLEHLSAIDQQKQRRHEVAVLAKYLTATLQIDPAGLSVILALGGDAACRSNLEAVQGWVERRMQIGELQDPAQEVKVLRTWLTDGFDL